MYRPFAFGFASFATAALLIYVNAVSAVVA